jgi:hypothetical protein
MNKTDLKYHVSKGPDRFFFTRDTMRFFGDTMRNYGVRSATVDYHWDESGNNYTEIPRKVEVWELYRIHPVKHGLRNSAYFDKVTYRRILPGA